MFAIIAAVLFGLALLLHLIEESLGRLLTPTALVYAGLLALAVHMIPMGRGRSWRRRP